MRALLTTALFLPLWATAQFGMHYELIASNDIGGPDEWDSQVIEMEDGREFVVKALSMGQGCMLIIEPETTEGYEGKTKITSLEGQCMISSANSHGLFVNTPIQVMRVRRFKCTCPPGRFATINTYEMPTSK